MDKNNPKFQRGDILRFIDANEAESACYRVIFLKDAAVEHNTFHCVILLHDSYTEILYLPLFTKVNTLNDIGKLIYA